MTQILVKEAMEQAPVRVAVGFQNVPGEDEGMLTSVTVKDSRSLSIINRNAGQKEQVFRYDAVFNQDTDQEIVYEELVKPLISRARLGYNVALVVSGTYVSGKNRLLRGDEKQDGIVQKLTKDLFEELDKGEDHRKRLITVSNIQFQIDGSTVDLLNPHDREIQCLHHPVLGLITEELSEFVVSRYEDAWDLYLQGAKAEKLAGAHLDRCSTLFTISLEQQETSGSCLHSSIRLFDLTGEAEKGAVNGATPLVYILNAEPSHGCIGTLLDEALGGNSYSVLIYCLKLTESWPGQTVSALTLTQGLKDLTNYVTLNCWDYRELMQNLRASIRELRMKISSNGDLCNEDVKRLGSLVQELQMVKQQRWERKEERSQQFGEECRQRLAAKSAAPFHSDLDRVYAAAMKRRSKLAEDNAALVQGELMRMERELQLHEAGSTVTADGTARLRREREVVVLQLVALRREKKEAEKDLQSMHQNYKTELENQKLKALQVLREFREASRLQLTALEKRYRKLLQDAIQDAVYLAAQKQQLELDKQHLKETIAELHDQLSVTKQRGAIPHRRDGAAD
ncbi:chromosome-associated kinesin KIF4A isoform X4 [Scyliorhinus canicula]|uniref:chromosome-associated kinesin KIF4A isoform X4 n=1 Tax=Scyliorhinus canicula TaxID=7830 RepID=UPI0018F2A389|nr:chromosome-associated kinesin KIF4A isoform X4 [Scyliorhinus canicula]